MSKELEALEFENPTLNLDFDYTKNGDIQYAVINLYYDGINHIIYDTTDKEQIIALSKIMQAENKKQQDLQRLESINNANPSEALKCFSKLIYKYIPYYIAYSDTGWVANIVKTINAALIKAQEQEKKNTEYKKALKIIFEKRVDIALVNVVNNVEQYNKIYIYDHNLNVEWCLTEEEFNFLKEMTVCQKN